jgi:hypothetical protein
MAGAKRKRVGARRLVRCVATVLALGLPAGQAAGQSFFDRYIVERAGASPCYARQLGGVDPPERRQRLQRFFVRQSENGRLKPPRTFAVEFGFTVNGLTDLFSGKANCETVGLLARCSVERDGGRFTLSPQGEGLRLTVGNRLVLQGKESFSPDLADGNDDLVFALQPGPLEACGVD